MRSRTEWIKREDCKIRGAYLLDSRNLRIGVWDGDAFIGIRSKFGARFLSTEYHWDDGEPCGTVKPIEHIEDMPESVLIERDEDKTLFTYLEGLENTPR